MIFLYKCKKNTWKQNICSFVIYADTDVILEKDNFNQKFDNYCSFSNGFVTEN